MRPIAGVSDFSTATNDRKWRRAEGTSRPEALSLGEARILLPRAELKGLHR